MAFDDDLAKARAEAEAVSAEAAARPRPSPPAVARPAWHDPLFAALSASRHPPVTPYTTRMRRRILFAGVKYDARYKKANRGYVVSVRQYPDAPGYAFFVDAVRLSSVNWNSHPADGSKGISHYKGGWVLVDGLRLPPDNLVAKLIVALERGESQQIGTGSIYCE